MSEINFDIVVIGGGPAGTIFALEMAAVGRTVALIDSRKTLGGTCLNVGCIPSKVLLHDSHFAEKNGVQSADAIAKSQERKRRAIADLSRGLTAQLREKQVTMIGGEALSLEPQNKVLVRTTDGETLILSARNQTVIASGSAPVLPTNLPVPDGRQILTSSHALDLEACPKSLVIVGGGAIGIEIGCIWARFGAKVTVIEALPTLFAQCEQDVVAQMLKALQRRGIRLMLSTQVVGTDKISDDELQVTVRNADGVEHNLIADKLLVSVGRKANTDWLANSTLAPDLDAYGNICADDCYRTNITDVYAIGDATAGPKLAHKAEADARRLALILRNPAAPLSAYPPVPSVVYTHPELAAVGLTLLQAQEQFGKENGISGDFNFIANGKARAEGERDGVLRVVANRNTGQLLGVHCFCLNAGDIISTATVALAMNARLQDIAATIFPHPTVSEGFKEACHSALHKL